MTKAQTMVSTIRKYRLARAAARSRRRTPSTPRPTRPTVTYGLAEFIAQEEMDRDEGYWFAPDDRSYDLGFRVVLRSSPVLKR